tara:strand:+ start:6738 stop:7205 length:468 start_codon:yes stop_codon:yes gene_type:complete
MIMGVDCSSKGIHAVLLDEKNDIVHSFKINEKNPDFSERLVEIFDKFQTEISKINIRKTAIEKAIYIQNAKATIQIASVITAIQLSCHKQNIPCELVDNKTWKKHIIGNGNSSKKDIMEYAISEWGNIFTEQDYADAACIALYGVKNSEDINAST